MVIVWPLASKRSWSFKTKNRRNFRARLMQIFCLSRAGQVKNALNFQVPTISRARARARSLSSKEEGRVHFWLSVEGSGAIRLYTRLPVHSAHRTSGSKGSAPHFISPLMIPQNKLHVQDGYAVFGAALLSQCFLLARGAYRTTATSDRWEVSLSKFPELKKKLNDRVPL